MPMDIAAFLAEKKNRELHFSAAVAMTPNRVIGKDGGMPWHLPEDLKVFRHLTTGHPIAMGRKTFDSMKRALPQRQNIVLTRDTSWTAEGVTRISTPEELLQLALMDNDIFIIGGSEIFALFLPLIDTLYVSRIHQEYEGDTVFPPFESLFQAPELIEAHEGFDLYRYSKKP